MAKKSRAVRLYEQYSIEQLQALQQQIEKENPITDQRYDGIFLYPQAVRKHFEDIAQAITWHLIDARKASGTWNGAAGYSGRQQKRF